VTLVSGPVSLDAPRGVKVVAVQTAAEMAVACKNAFRTADAAVMTAAVCDYRPTKREKLKLPKQTRAFSIRLEPTEDIAAALGKAKGKRILVGFAMEDHNHHAKAERKLSKKNCDLIVMNGPSNIGGDRAVVEFFSKAEGWSRRFQGTKAAVARELLRRIERLIADKGITRS
jgi:phosphopantothenoylcysteine decarboxylase/phosphopantothenate--cysteine ligase